MQNVAPKAGGMTQLRSNILVIPPARLFGCLLKRGSNLTYSFWKKDSPSPLKEN
jgi:hypothetical protein